MALSHQNDELDKACSAFLPVLPDVKDPHMALGLLSMYPWSLVECPSSVWQEGLGHKRETCPSSCPHPYSRGAREAPRRQAALEIQQERARGGQV